MNGICNPEKEREGKGDYRGLGCVRSAVIGNSLPKTVVERCCTVTAYCYSTAVPLPVTALTVSVREQKHSTTGLGQWY